MGRASAFLGGLVVVFSMTAVAPVQVAEAGLRRCDKNRLHGADVQKARNLSIKSAAGHVIEWSTQNACTNTNPDGAWSWVEIKSEPQPDGAVLDGHVFCGREAATWECSIELTRSAVAKLNVGERKREVKFALPLGLDLGTARNLLQQAVDLAPTLRSEQGCGDGPLVDEKERKMAEESLADVRREFALGYGESSMAIERQEAELGVVTGSSVLEFTPAAGDAARFNFSCWTIEITVT